MTEQPETTPATCAAPHPNPEVDVVCELEPGPNAQTDDGVDVHVHKGYEPDGSPHRWEDVPT
jgi:hypothetical protein